MLRPWVWVNLVLLTVCAWLGARVINNIVAYEVVRLPTRAAVAAPVRIEPERRPTDTWQESIAARNLFNADPPSEQPDAGVPDAAPVAEPEEPPRPGEPCEQAEGNLALVATMVAQPARASRAVLRKGRRRTAPTRMVRPGQKVGDVVVAAIHPTRAVLREGNDYSCVKLGEKPKRKRRVRERSRSKRSKASANIARSVKKVGRDRYQVDREMLDEQLNDLHALGRQVRIRPHRKRGKAHGFKLLRVRSGSLFFHLGLRRGDVFAGVNGETVTSPNEALALFDRLKTARDVTVTVERRGRPRTLEYAVR